MRRTMCARLYSLLWLISLIGCGRAINRSVERRIRESLPDLLGSASEYHVHVSSALTRTVQGRLADVTVDGRDVQFANGLLLDSLHLDLKGVDSDLTHRKLRHIDSTQFTAGIGQDSLDEFLAGEAPAGETLKKIHVTLNRDNEVTIRGERVTLGVGVPFQIDGTLRVAGPKRVELDPQRLKVIGVPLPGFILEFLKTRFESGIDLGSLPFPIRLTGVSTTPGTLTISGTADVVGLIQRRQEGQ